MRVPRRSRSLTYRSLRSACPTFDNRPHRRVALLDHGRLPKSSANCQWSQVLRDGSRRTEPRLNGRCNDSLDLAGCNRQLERIPEIGTRKLTRLSYLALSKDGPTSVKPYSPVHEEWPISLEAALVVKNEAVGPASIGNPPCRPLAFQVADNRVRSTCHRVPQVWTRDATEALLRPREGNP